MTRVMIGTSGYSYPSWKNNFYPERLPSSKWFEYYCSRFNSIELKFAIKKRTRIIIDAKIFFKY